MISKVKEGGEHAEGRQESTESNRPVFGTKNYTVPRRRTVRRRYLPVIPKNGTQAANT